MTESFAMSAALSGHDFLEGHPTAADAIFANEAMPYPMIPPFERDDPPRRTRKRFSSAQLMMLEHLFHQTSHPTREQREFLAREANMCVHFTRISCVSVSHSRVRICISRRVLASVTDRHVTFFGLLIITFQSELRSVTVWFQNKRQTERKVALQSAAGGAGDSQLTSQYGMLIAHYQKTLTHAAVSQGLQRHRPCSRVAIPRVGGQTRDLGRELPHLHHSDALFAPMHHFPKSRRAPTPKPGGFMLAQRWRCRFPPQFRSMRRIYRNHERVERKYPSTTSPVVRSSAAQHARHARYRFFPTQPHNRNLLVRPTGQPATAA